MANTEDVRAEKSFTRTAKYIYKMSFFICHGKT
jgi:hypothetical protein